MTSSSNGIPGGSALIAARDLRQQADVDGSGLIRCLIVDDHPAIRVGLRELLAVQPGLRVVDAVCTAEAGWSLAERTRIDVAIVDYQLGGHSGLWLSRQLQRLPDPPAVLIYSAFSDHLLAAACVVAQASALVSKAALGDELAIRIREVAAGERRLPLIPPILAESLRRRLDVEEQSIFGMMSATVPVEEIARTLGFRDCELDERLWRLLRKLEGLDRPRPF